MPLYINMLYKIKPFLLILGIIASIATLNSKIEVIQAQTTAELKLKHILDQAKSLAINTIKDNYKDKVYSPPSNTMDLLDVCHKQAKNNPGVSDPGRYCFHIIIEICQKNNLSAEECYAINFVSFKAENIDVAVLNSANAKMEANTNKLDVGK